MNLGKKILYLEETTYERLIEFLNDQETPSIFGPYDVGECLEDYFSFKGDYEILSMEKGIINLKKLTEKQLDKIRNNEKIKPEYCHGRIFFPIDLQHLKTYRRQPIIKTKILGSEEVYGQFKFKKNDKNPYFEVRYTNHLMGLPIFKFKDNN